MVRTPRPVATQFFELVVSWSPTLLSCVQSAHSLYRNSSAPNPTHNVPIYVLTTLWGILRWDPVHNYLQTAFWDGMGRQLTNALIVVLLALENHECRLEHNLRSLPDVILRVLHHLSDVVQVQPTFNQVQRCVHAIGRCGWSRTRSRLACAWVTSVRLALSDRDFTARQEGWKALLDTIRTPDVAYFDKFEFPPGLTANPGEAQLRRQLGREVWGTARHAGRPGRSRSRRQPVGLRGGLPCRKAAARSGAARSGAQDGFRDSARGKQERPQAAGGQGDPAGVDETTFSRRGTPPWPPPRAARLAGSRRPPSLAAHARPLEDSRARCSAPTSGSTLLGLAGTTPHRRCTAISRSATLGARSTPTWPTALCGS